MMHGKGILTWKNGKKYNGEFNNNKREGKGICVWKDGRKYDGMWLDGKEHGMGNL